MSKTDANGHIWKAVASLLGPGDALSVRSVTVEAVQAMLPSGVMLTFPDGGLLRTTVKTATDSWVSDLCHLHLLGMPQILGARGASVQSIAVESGVPPPSNTL